ncbi:site-specific integrase [uncultured Ligilactobacillus sp.]|uniref:tyrosine-type recombinase/integrase n=1 Tax=uncultured Ligilactobacillus sp. TaxID=2837633 RepID=UPI00272BC75D|nr:site-specific integrase [uncultured Ligilactobacillus sp.]
MKKTKYPNVYQDDKGNFFYQIFLGRDISGKQKFKKGRKDEKGRPFTSARLAYIEAIRLKNEYLEENGSVVYRMTYRSFMTNKFIPKYSGDVEESTFSTHKKAFEYAISKLGDKLLEDITVMDCEEYRTWLLTESGFSKSYCSMVYIAFRQSLDYAVTLGILKNNVSMQTKSISKGKSVVKYWNKDQFEAVLSKIYVNDYYEHFCFILIWLYFMTGVRVSEGLALRWADIDLKNSRMRVHHTLDFKNKSNYTIKPYTKTSSGKRMISLDNDTVDYLREWQRIQLNHGVKNFVMSYDDTPMVRSTISRIIKKYAKLAEVPQIEAKGLRHSHVSYLINEFNADVLTVSRRLGHSSPDITLKHYSHLWRRNDDMLAEMMTGNIKFKFSEEKKINFNGNQFIMNDCLPNVCQNQ